MKFNTLITIGTTIATTIATVSAGVFLPSIAIANPMHDGSSERSIASSKPTKVCAYDPSTGKPNPLGMRASLRLEETQGNTIIKYQQLPTMVKGGLPRATIDSERRMVMYQVTAEEARRVMLKDPDYYKELTGGTIEEFKAVNAVLVCKSTQAATPTGKTIADLPNGTYRFWNGTAKPPLTDDALLKNGGVLLVVSKQGHQVLGYFGQIDNTGACIRGSLTGSKFSGIAIPAELSTDPASRSNTSFDPGGFLKLGTWKKVGNAGYYDNSSMDVAKLNLINLGNSKAPTNCAPGFQ